MIFFDTYKEQGRKTEIQAALKQLHWEVYESETPIPEDLCYLSGKYLEDIIDVIRESVDVIDVMKPIYNFKASD